MAGLRERKKLATRLAIHEAGMRLFAERGFGGTTVDDIAEAAGVSRATVFTYYATKEEIVFGEAAAAVAGLAAMLAESASTVAVVRAWITELTGWLEPELLVQLALAREAPTVAARRLQIYRDIEDVIAAALERELGPDHQLAARLSAASLMAGLAAIESAAAAQLSGGASSEPEHILDVTIGYLEAGLAAVASSR